MIWQVPSQIYGNTGVCRSDDEACELPELSHTQRQRTMLSCKDLYTRVKLNHNDSQTISFLSYFCHSSYGMCESPHGWTCILKASHALPEHTRTHTNKKTAYDAFLQRPVCSCQTQTRQPNNFLPFTLLPQPLRYG